MKKETWKQIFQIVLTILTALGTTLGVTSWYDITCRGYQGQGIGSERGGRTPHPAQHQDLEQR